MNVAVIGANGGIGRRLLPRLDQAGHDPIGVVRSDEQFDAIRERGGEPRLGDLEEEVAPALEEADAVVFTAGAGGSTGWDKTILVDLWGAERAVTACAECGIDRFVMVSSRGAGDPESRQGPIKPYIVAKHVADRSLQRSPLEETILRPTRLTDEEGTGRVAAHFGTDPETGPPIPRDDVAQAVVACLENKDTVGHAVTLYGGDTPIEEAMQEAS
ncbi:SDR family oxidoreductase [Salinibacter altiplanensis]|uniref:SDR family oxidoreductase n=1 Tax=Salinibacter altiplanensis TaxID=1803181 RepID=UPI000C9F2430|nr:SDR family oxidoreductase [Salinibacter altiplanensis]